MAVSTRSRRALVISPFATVPLDAGQRLRAYQSTQMFRELGYSITFLFYAFENQWYWRSQPELLAEMSRQWGDLRVVYSKRQVSEPPKHGDYHQLDEWWDDELGLMLNRMLTYEDYDICVVNNVWLSKAFDFIPSRTIRILDTHDVFHARRPVFEAAGIKPEFFLIDAYGEKFGLERADLILTIKPQEAETLQAIGVSRPILNLPYISCAQDKAGTGYTYHHPAKVTFGFLGTAHAFNVAGLNATLRALDRLIKKTLAPVELLIGGNVGSSIDMGAIDFRPVRLGYVEDEAAFYDSIDIAVVPVFTGTGFKVKVAELVQLRKPMLCAEHAGEGVELQAEMLVDSPEEMARQIVNIALHRPSLRDMQRRMNDAALKMQSGFNVARAAVQDAIAANRRTILFIPGDGPLNGVNMTRMLSTIVHARTVSHTQWSVIAVPRSWNCDLTALNAVAAPGSMFVSAEDSAAIVGDLASAGICAYVTPGKNEDKCNLLGPLRLAREQLIIDCRFTEMEDLDWNAIRDIRAAGTVMYNHLQSEDPYCLPNARTQDVICAPILDRVATWDPAIASIFRTFMKCTAPIRVRAAVLHSGSAAGRAVRSLLAAIEMRDIAVFDAEKPEEVDACVSTLLWALFDSGEPFHFISATSRAAWLRALADHASHIADRIYRGNLTAVLQNGTLAPWCDMQKSLAIASPHVYRELDGRISRTRVGQN